MPWSAWAALLVYALQFVLVGMVGLLLAMIRLADEGLANVILLPITSLATAGLTLLVVWGRHPGHVWRLRGPRRPRVGDLGRGLVYGIGAYAVINVALGTLLQAAITASGGEVPVIQESFREFAADPEAAPVFLVGAIALAPVGEELLYRGLLFSALRARFGRLPGILGSAAVFGFVHLNPTSTAAANLLVFVLIFGLASILAWAYDRAGSLAVPIAIHCTYNAISAVLLVTLEM